MKTGELIDNYDYDADGDVLYIGHASPGTPDGDSKWRIIKYFYDANKRAVRKAYAEGREIFAFSWTARATYDYR